MSRTLKSISKWSHPRPLLAIAGPTGSGKSQLAVEIAQKYDGEIINADALQLYRGLPLATNKLNKDEMKGVPHHLLDCIKLSDPPWYVGKYITEATKIIRDIHARGKLPIVVGGTHYYIHNLIFHDENTLPGLDGEVEATTKQWPVLEGSAGEMLEELRRLDPVAASWWHPNDVRKIRRSLEICLLTDRKVSDLYKSQMSLQNGDKNARVRYNALCLYLHADRATLCERLDARVDRMIEGGLMDEIRYMRQEREFFFSSEQSTDFSKGIWIAIGFKEFEAYLNAQQEGCSDSELDRMELEARERMKISTRQYAARQVRYVKNKLLPMFTKHQAPSLFQIIDATDLLSWETNIKKYAEEMTNAYLQGKEISHPGEPQDAVDFLNPSPQRHETHHCELCNVTTTNAEAWHAHLQNRRHRKLAKSQAPVGKRPTDLKDVVESTMPRR